jgi:hypothetical protein
MCRVRIADFSLTVVECSNWRDEDGVLNTEQNGINDRRSRAPSVAGVTCVLLAHPPPSPFCT